MIRNFDIPTFAIPATTREGLRPGLADAVAIGSIRSIRVKRSEMPKLLVAAVREDVAEALGGERDANVSLLLRQLENEYHRHWQMGTKAN